LCLGDVFRALDTRTHWASSSSNIQAADNSFRTILQFSSGKYGLAIMSALIPFKPDIDYLVLDGIPRNPPQAEIMQDNIEVKKVFPPGLPGSKSLVSRLRKRALEG
jgi:adenylate kinase